jgi:lysophospholipase L1-like esterase
MSAKSKRLIAILAVGFVLVGAALFYLFIRFVRPVGHGPAGPTITRNLFSSPWTDRPVLFIGLGDSVTAGFGARKGYGYFDRLVKNPPDEFNDMNGICLSVVMPKIQFTNFAISGSTSLEHMDRELPRLATISSNVLGIVVITTGGNDLIHNYGQTPPRDQAMYGADWEQARPWVDNFQQRLDLMISQINARFPGGCQIFLANIYDPTDGAGDIERAGLPPWNDGMKILDAYNDVIRRCADKHPNVYLVDFHSAFLGHGIHCAQFWTRHYDFKDPHYWFYDNLEDPNERGYDVIRRLFLIEIAKTASQLK